MKKLLTANLHRILLSVFILLFVGFSIGSSINESLTFDEIVYLQEGRQALLNHTFSIDPYNPPFIKELAVLPYLFNKNFYSNPLFLMQYPLVSKITIILLGIGVIVATYLLAKEYLGKSEAVFAAGLLSLEPTMLA